MASQSLSVKEIPGIRLAAASGTGSGALLASSAFRRCPPGHRDSSPDWLVRLSVYGRSMGSRETAWVALTNRCSRGKTSPPDHLGLGPVVGPILGSGLRQASYGNTVES